MNIQKVGVGAVIVVGLILGLIFPRGNTVIQQVANSASNLGSIVGPDDSNNYHSYAGFEEDFFTQSFQTSTSTICAIKTPTATSTLVGAFLNVSTSDSAGGSLFIATSTTPYATTSLVFAIPAAGITLQPNLLPTVVAGPASSTASSFTANNVIAPNQFLVFDIKGKLTYTYRGKCYAEFRTFK